MRTNSLPTINALTHTVRIRRSHEPKHSIKSARFLLSLFLLVIFLFSFPLVSFAATNVSGHITSDTTWTLAGSPYIVTGDVTVRSSTARHYSESNKMQVTLTIEPGVQVRFEPGTGLYIAHPYSHPDYGYYGALKAQGTEGAPIIFTSNAASPAPGDWKGIYFRDQTDDSNTLIEHCIVEYGGQSHNANIYSDRANPAINNSEIRYSSGSGIYLNSSSPTITNSVISETTVTAFISTYHPTRPLAVMKRAEILLSRMAPTASTLLTSDLPL